MSTLDYAILRPVKAIALLFIILGFYISAPSRAAENLALGIDDITLSIPDGWSFARHANYHRIYNIPKQEQAAIDADALKQNIYISVFASRQANHTAALQGLQQIASGSGSSTAFLPIAGWPAVQQQRLTIRPQPGSETTGQSEEVLIITTGAYDSSSGSGVHGGRYKRSIVTGSAVRDPAGRLTKLPVAQSCRLSSTAHSSVIFYLWT